MNVAAVFDAFYEAILEDPRIAPRHISLYMGLLYYSGHLAKERNFYVFSREVIPYAKFSSGTTYFSVIKDLNEFGYIRYMPSHDNGEGSHIEFRGREAGI